MMMTDTKRNANSEGMILSEMGPYDVLLGRGTGPNNNLGNLRYREVVKSTMAKYAAAAPHPNNNINGEDSDDDDDDDVTPVVPVVKGQIVNEILDAVRLLGGRFVRKLTKEEMKMVLDRHNNNSNKPNHHSGGSSKTKKTMTTSSSSSKKFNKRDLFVIVTNRMAAEKTKQSIRFQLNKKQNKNSSGTFTNRGNSSMAAKIIAAKARFERNKKTTTTVPRQEDEDDLKVSATATTSSSKKKADVQDAWSPQQATARGGNSLQALHGHAASRSSTLSSSLTKVNAPGLLNETASTRLVETRSSPTMVTRDPYLGRLGPSPFLLNSNSNLLHRLGLTSPPGLSSSITSSGLGLDPAAAVVADSLYGVPRMPAPPLSLSSSWLCGGRAAATTRQHPLLSARTTQQILQDALIIAESEARVRSSAEARVAATAAAAIESLRRHHLLN